MPCLCCFRVVGDVGDGKRVGTCRDDVACHLTFGGGFCGRGQQGVDVAKRVGFPPEGFGFHHGYRVVRGCRDVACRISTVMVCRVAMIMAHAGRLAALAGGHEHCQQEQHYKRFRLPASLPRGKSPDEGNC